jgi:hypothetical protein
MTYSATIASPPAMVTVKLPFSPAIDPTSALSMTLILCSAACRSHMPSTASRLPASKSMSERSTSWLGVAITCLPF